jgi:hypothetical protein
MNAALLSHHHAYARPQLSANRRCRALPAGSKLLAQVHNANLV